MFHAKNSSGNFTLCLRNKKDINCFLQLMGYKRFFRDIQLTNFDIWYENIVTNLLKQFTKCQLCGKGFKNQWNLSQHKPVHTGERKHVCGCGKKFTQKSNLYKHTKRNSCVFYKIKI